MQSDILTKDARVYTSPSQSSGGTYQYQKVTQKSTKVFERFLRILPQFCCSIFRLIISKQKFRFKSQGAVVKLELFRMESGMQTKCERV